MLSIKRNDIVWVTKGKDRGKKGKVLKILSLGKRVIVEGINLVKKHMRRTQQDQQGGIVSVEAPISIANLALFCKNCNAPSRTGVTVLSDGTKTRICKKCKSTI